MNHRTLIASPLILVGALLAFGQASAAYQTTLAGPAQWATTNAALGLNPGAVIEDFEDTALVSGLQVQVSNSSSGAYGPTSTLPNTFNPNTNDGFGTAFVGGNWDGNRVLLNTGNNQSVNYGSTSAWGDVTFTFANGLTQVGFSLQQMQHDATITINGSTSFNASSLVGFDFSGGRSGYLRIDVTGGSAPITSLNINGTIYDAWTIDHLAMTTAVPEPQGYALMLAALFAACLIKRRVRS